MCLATAATISVDLVALEGTFLLSVLWNAGPLEKNIEEY
jgi:hypothetical protein